MRQSAVVALAALLVAACAAPGMASPSPDLAAPPETSPPPAGVDPFADLTYRFELPAGWVALGSPDYDVAPDEAVTRAGWLDALDLDGPYAFRAYEPIPGAGGMRIAVNPQSPWRASEPALLDEGRISALPGVSGEPLGEIVGVGEAGKATRFRWTETLDWGDGAPAAREAVGYYLMAGGYAPVNVVMTWPAGASRLPEAEALMATFRVTGDPVISPPPGTTMPPSPTPFDKFASPPPAPPDPTSGHAFPALEALLPDTFGGDAVEKSSWTGVDDGRTDEDPVLAEFGKHPSDVAIARAASVMRPMLGVQVERLAGVSAEEVLATRLRQWPEAKVTDTTLGGKPVAYVEFGMVPVWYYRHDDLLFGVVGIEDDVAEALAALP